MIGVIENFPRIIHRKETFETNLPKNQIQKKIVQTLQEINQKKYCFEEITYPTVPNCKIIFEAGLAESKIFNYIDKEEKERFLKAIKNKINNQLDLFFSIRYYKIDGKKKHPLNFDYYMLRFSFHNKIFQLKIFHEKGPRYITPEGLEMFIINEINKKLASKIARTKKLNYDLDKKF
jgi:hypothetical protein